MGPTINDYSGQIMLLFLNLIMVQMERKKNNVSLPVTFLYIDFEIRSNTTVVQSNG